MKAFRVVVVAVLLLGLTGCAGLGNRDQRILSGAGLGAAAGVGTAAVVGAPLAIGALGGCAAGALAGLLIDQFERR